jgi:uncharacterized protein (DUF302 family)
MKTFILGFLLGPVVLLASLVLYFRAQAPALMLPEQRSPHSLETTVQRLSDAAKASGWVVSSVTILDESVSKHGGPKVRPVRLVNLCQAHHAGRILQDDTARRVSVLMPCTIAVYEKQDGSIWVAAMNPGLLAPVFGGVVAEVMGGPVAREQASFIASLQTK